jgi:hypothetical protein
MSCGAFGAGIESRSTRSEGGASTAENVQTPEPARSAGDPGRGGLCHWPPPKKNPNFLLTGLTWFDKNTKVRYLTIVYQVVFGRYIYET